MVVVLWVYIPGIIAQQKIQFALTDDESGKPIENAYYQYGENSGVTEDEGLIRIQYEESLLLYISHLQYGSWEMSSEEILEAGRSGVSQRGLVTNHLQPVTVMALRTVSAGEKYKLQYEDHLAHDAAQILTRNPVVSTIRKSGNYGFDPVVRGFKYDQLNIVMDGVQSAAPACPNRMDPPTSQVAPNMLERIEILKGPYQVRFGNSFGATLNFISAGPDFSSQFRFGGRLSSHYETNGNITRNEAMLSASGQFYQLRLFGSWSEGNDYTDGGGAEVGADFQRASVGAQLDVQLTDRQELMLSVAKNQALDTDFPALPMDLRSDDTWLLRASHSLSFDNRTLKEWNSSIFSTKVDHVMDNLSKSLDPRMLNAETVAETFNYGGRSELQFAGVTWKLFTGLDFKSDFAAGERTRTFLRGPMAGMSPVDNAWQDGHISRTGVFYELRKNVNKQTIVFSGRLEYNNATVDDLAPEFSNVVSATDQQQINPTISIGYLTDIAGQVDVSLWAGRSQRSGSMTERYINYFPVGLDPFELLGNPSLDPEVNNQIDLSLEYTGREVLVSVNVFGSLLENYITGVIREDLTPRLPMSPGVRQFENTGTAYKSGVELSYSQRFTGWLSQNVEAAYVYARFDDGSPLPEIPPFDLRYRLRGSLFKGKLQPDITVRAVAAQMSVNREFGEVSTPSFATIGAGVSYEPIQKLQLSVRGENLLNEEYYEHLNRTDRLRSGPLFAPGRSFIFSAYYRF